MEPDGYLPFKVCPEPSDRLILSPVYVFPVEALERGLFSRPQFYFQTALVNGYDGRVSLVDEREIRVDRDFAPEGQTERLALKVSPGFAVEAARFQAVPEDCQSWRRVVKNRKVFVRAEDMKLVWRVYIVRDGEVTDTFTGEKSASASLVGMLFG